MFWIAVALLVIGSLIAIWGVFLNLNTPYQQPLPVVGGGIAFIGFVVLLLWF